MSKLKSIRSKGLKLYLAEYAKFKADNYLNNRIEQEKQNIETQWLSNFKDGDYFIHNLNEDVKLKLYKDSNLSRLIYDGFEKNELELTGKILKNGDIFLDIGANIGLYSLTASSLVGETGIVISFEPTPKTFSRLVENIQLNNLSNIRAYNIGISHKEELLSLNISENGYEAWNTFASTSSEKFQHTKYIQVSMLDIQCDKIDKNKIKLIKIDVEGWEKYVLLGGTNLFKNYNPVVMVEFTETNTYAAGYFVQELYDILYNWGYRWFRYINNEFVPEDRQLHYPYDNLVALKDMHAIKKIIESQE